MNTISTSSIGKEPSGQRPRAVRGRGNGTRRWATLAVVVALVGYAGIAFAGIAEVQDDAGRERVALVIGNGHYERLGNLDPSGPTDAEGVGAALGRLGFTVTTLTDAGYQDMAWGLEEFAQAAQSAQAAVVFYAGHGFAAADGRNYLAPVDLLPKTHEAAVDPDVVNVIVTQANLGLIPVEWLMRSVAGASNLRLVVLDTDVQARLEPAGGAVVAQGAAVDQHVWAGGGRESGHSPYTGALLRYLEEPGLELGMLFRKVRADVVRATDGSQEPVVYGTLPPESIYLASAAAQPPVVAGGDPAADEVPATPSPAETEERLGLGLEQRRLVQMGLAAAGYEIWGAADGIFGGRTRNALRAWQESKGFEGTGYLTKAQSETLAALGGGRLVR